MHRLLSCAIVLLLCIAGNSAHAQDLVLYDDFKAGFIDPAKWVSWWMCGSAATDCAREVQKKKGRLAVRNYGATFSDSGVSYDAAQLNFRNAAKVEAISVRFTVKSFSSAPCPTNPEAAHPQLLISGPFFNAGTGDPSDDVVAFFMVERRTDDPWIAPTSLRVGAFMGASGGFFNGTDLGTLETDEEATATLAWDRPNHRFIVRIERRKTTPLVVERTMPYDQTDVTPASSVAMKSITVGGFAPNCSGGGSFTAMDATFDDVRVNASALP